MNYFAGDSLVPKGAWWNNHSHRTAPFVVHGGTGSGVVGTRVMGGGYTSWWYCATVTHLRVLPLLTLLYTTSGSYHCWHHCTPLGQTLFDTEYTTGSDTVRHRVHYQVHHWSEFSKIQQNSANLWHFSEFQQNSANLWHFLGISANSAKPTPQWHQNRPR